jgi:hypothetical protein
VLVGRGTTYNQSEPLATHSLHYTADELAWGQLVGDHSFDWIDVEWRTALARSFEDQPDGRFDTRSDPDGTNVWSSAAFGGRRAFGDLREVLTDSAVDFTVPFRPGCRSPTCGTGSTPTFSSAPHICTASGTTTCGNSPGLTRVRSSISPCRPSNC